MFTWLCKGRCLEFFEGDDGRLSMTRLLCFLSFWPATYVVIVHAKSDSIENILMIYLSAFVGGYIGGKTADIFMKPKVVGNITQNTTVNQPENVNVPESANVTVNQPKAKKGKTNARTK